VREPPCCSLVPKISIRGWDDALVSGTGDDVMTGGFGYVFNALNQSGVGNSDLTSRVPTSFFFRYAANRYA
jgi:hypothetical protein